MSALERWSRGVVAVGVRRHDGAAPAVIGTGFFVDVSGTIVTAAHVIFDIGGSARQDPATYVHPGDPDNAEVAIGLGDPLTWHFVANVRQISYTTRSHPETRLGGYAEGRSDPDGLDLAVLQLVGYLVPEARADAAPLDVPVLDAMGNPIVAVPLAEPATLHRDHYLALVGYGFADNMTSSRNHLTNTQGVYSGTQVDDRGGEWIKTDAAMLGGHSGQNPAGRQTLHTNPCFHTLNSHRLP